MGQDIFWEKFTPVGMSRMAGLNAKNRITMLKTGLWESICGSVSSRRAPTHN